MVIFMYYNIKTCCAFLTERAFCCLVTSSELQQMWVFLDELPSYLKAIIPWKWSQDVFLFLVSLYSIPSCYILTDREVGGWEWSRNKFPWPLYPPTITSPPSYHLSGPNRTPILPPLLPQLRLSNVLSWTRHTAIADTSNLFRRRREASICDAMLPIGDLLCVASKFIKVHIVGGD